MSIQLRKRDRHELSCDQLVKIGKSQFTRLLLLESGQVKIEQRDINTLLKKNQFCLLPPGATCKATGAHSSSRLHVFKAQLPQKTDYGSGMYLHMTEKIKGHAQELFFEMERSASWKPWLRDEAIDHCLSLIFVYALREMLKRQPGKAPKKPQHAVGAIRQLVRQNLHSRQSVESIFKHSLASDRQTARLFKEETGMSIKQYMIEEKVKEAKRLMKTTSMNLTEMAHELGFSSSQHFSNTFRRVTGISPKTHQKQAKY